MDIVTGSITAIMWFVTFLYLVTRSENQCDCRDGGAIVLLAMPIAFVAVLITAVPLIIAQNFCAFSSGWFAVLVVLHMLVLYKYEKWIRSKIQEIFQALA